MITNQHHPIRKTRTTTRSHTSVVRRFAHGLAALAAVLGTSLGVIAATGAQPASAWVPPGPSGMPTSQGTTRHLNCNSMNINGADVIAYIEAPQENHGTVHPGEELWVSYQIHKSSTLQQWPLSANNGIHTTDAPYLAFFAPTNTQISGPAQLFTPGAGKLVSWPQLVPSAMQAFGDLAAHPVYPGKQATNANVTAISGGSVLVNVQGNSRPSGSYNDGFYLEVRYPVRVTNTGTVTVLPLPNFGGEDGTWNVFDQHYEDYTCSYAGSNTTGLSFTSTPYLLYF